MITLASDRSVREAARHLAANDSALAPLVERFGLCPIRPHKNYYRELVESIIGQQLSVKAAASINRKFLTLFNEMFPEPAAILEKSVEELRTAGLSGAKAKYVRDLAQHVLDGRLEFDKFDAMSNEDIIAELLPVKGIGEWTAHMFLMFCMGRADILPVGDLGIRTGIKKLYDFEALPDAAAVREVAASNNWHPYESIASWYIWASLDNKPAL